MIWACRSLNDGRPRKIMRMCRHHGPARPCRIVSVLAFRVAGWASCSPGWPVRGWHSRSTGCVRAGAFRPGRMHDQTALKTEGICDLFERFPRVKALVDAGYRGLARQFPDQVTAPPLKPGKDAPPCGVASWEISRKAQSSQRIPAEHANAEHKQWRTLQRYTGRREYYDETHRAIAGLVSDRAARR